MKKNILPILILCFTLSVFLVSCQTTATSEPPAVTATASPVQEIVPTKTMLPTETSAPTAAPSPTPEPLPCTIVFDSNRDDNLEIYRMAPDGSNTVNLSLNSGDDFDPAISPDGSQVAFISNRAFDQGEDGGQFIYVMNIDGSDVHQLTRENESKYPDWSNDGSRITYTHKGDIYIINADGSGESINLTNSSDLDEQSAWSPDGSQIAWLLEEQGNRNAFVMNTDGSNMHPITDNGQVGRVLWINDGRLLTDWGWQDQDEFCHQCIVNSAGTQIEDAGGKGEVEQLIPFWTMEGDLVGVANVDAFAGNDEIYLVGQIFPDPEGLGVGFLNLSNNPASDRNPDWPANCGPAPKTSISNDVQEQGTGQGFVIGYEDNENNMSDQDRADLKRACQELQIQCVKGDDISKLAEQNVDAIISASNRWHVMGAYPKIHEAVAKGIPVFMLNAETGEPGAYNLSVESDSVIVGLKWMFNEMDAAGEFVYFNVGNNSFHQSLIDQALKGLPEIQATALPADYEANSVTEEKVAALVTANPNLKAIWSNEGLENLFWGSKNAQTESAPAILCSSRKDILLSWKDRIAEDPSFRCLATVKPGGTGYEGVYVAYYLLTGLKIDPAALGGLEGNTFIYDFPVITNDNLDQWLAKIDSLQIGEWDTLQMPPMTADEIKEKWFLE